MKYGKLTFIEELLVRDTNRAIMWKCLCDCGSTTITRRLNVLTGKTQSCGCMLRKHGGRDNRKKTKEYSAWGAMRNRCNNPQAKEYLQYGGRGITVCDAWTNFETFLVDVGFAPTKQHTIDRINVNGNYEPINVKWATIKEQARNRRNNRFLTVGNETKCITEWATIYHINHKTIADRIKRGWSEYDAVTKPSQRVL